MQNYIITTIPQNRKRGLGTPGRPHSKNFHRPQTDSTRYVKTGKTYFLRAGLLIPEPDKLGIQAFHKL